MRDLLADFQRGTMIDVLHGSGIDIVFVLPVPASALIRFVGESASPTFVRERLFADPTATIAKAAACNKKFDSRKNFTSPHAQTSVLQATLRGLAIGLRTGPQGDPRQQGGSWVLEMRGSDPASPDCWTTVWGKRDRHNADQVPLPVLMRVSGAPAHAYTHPRAMPAIAKAHIFTLTKTREGSE